MYNFLILFKKKIYLSYVWKFEESIEPIKTVLFQNFSYFVSKRSYYVPYYPKLVYSNKSIISISKNVQYQFLLLENISFFIEFYNEFCYGTMLYDFVIFQKDFYYQSSIYSFRYIVLKLQYMP